MNNKLCAGFARVDITPEIGGMPMAGYGDTERRLAARILDPLYVNAVALRSGDENCVFLTMDLCELNDDVFPMLRNAVRDATGLSETRIFIDTTHTHSGADLNSPLPSAVKYRTEELTKKLAEAAARALADLQPAKLSYGSIRAGSDRIPLNFNRYYYITEIDKKNDYKPEDRICVGDNFGWQYTRQKDRYCYVGHEEEADPSLQVMRFARNAADDIILLNFAAHATITGGRLEANISADFPGALRKRVEELLPGTKCSFMQGCAGNVNCATRMEEEGIYGLTYGKNRSHIAYGNVLAGYAFQALNENMRESETDEIAFRHSVFTAKMDHSMDALVPKAEKVIEVYRKEGYTENVRALCLQNGFNSIYHCLFAVGKAKKPETGSFAMNAIRVGDCAIVTAPFELFSATGLHIKIASPFAQTFVSNFSCGYHSYLPSMNSTNNSYESNCAYFARGTAEEMEKEYQKMLLELTKERN